MSKSSTQKVNVVLSLLCFQMPGKCGIGDYPYVASFATICLNEMIPDYLRPHIPHHISRYSKP